MSGRKVRCPGCGGRLVVPQVGARKNEEAEALDILLADTSVREGRDQPGPGEDAPPDSKDSRPDTGYQTRRPMPSPPPSPAAPPKAPRRRRERSEAGLSIVVNGEIITGLLMMTGAAGWFFLGMAAGVYYIYPPILFVLGIAAVIRGFRGER